MDQDVGGSVKQKRNAAEAGEPLSEHSSLGKVAGALTDVLSCGFFLLTWVAPLTVGVEWIGNLMAVMLVEFLAVHSGGLIGLPLLDPAYSRVRKTLIVVGAGALYMIFAGAFSYAMETWWPAAAFAWLLLSKLILVWLSPLPHAAERDRQKKLVGFSVLAYIGGIFLTTLLWVPELGVTDEVRNLADLPGSGLWVDDPQSVLAFGFLYFGATAWFKIRL